MKHLALISTLTALALSVQQGAMAAPFAASPDTAKGTINLESRIPLRTFAGAKMPQGTVVLEDGTLSLTIVPEWNFDRVPVLAGPIIRTQVTSSDKETLVTGVVLFTQGYWYEKFWNPASHDVVVASTGTYTGRISGLQSTVMTVTQADGTTVDIPMSQVQELHSPRAFGFAIPVLSASATPDTAWTGDAPTVALTPTANTSLPRVASDPLLRSDGDWSTARLVTLGTVLSIAQIAQFVPALVLALENNHFKANALRQEYQTIMSPAPTPATAAPPRGFPMF